MLKFSLSFIGMIFAFGLSVLVMIFGWGLEPQSWGWIIGGSFGGALIAGFIAAGAG